MIRVNKTEWKIETDTNMEKNNSEIYLEVKEDD